jgi:hypothetical protein
MPIRRCSCGLYPLIMIQEPRKALNLVDICLCCPTQSSKRMRSLSQRGTTLSPLLPQQMLLGCYTIQCRKRHPRRWLHQGSSILFWLYPVGHHHGSACGDHESRRWGQKMCRFGCSERLRHEEENKHTTGDANNGGSIQIRPHNMDALDRTEDRLGWC